MRASPITFPSPSQEQKVIPTSKIITLIEKALQSQTPPKNPDLFEIFETWKNEEKILDEVDNKEKIAELLKLTFEVTYNLIKQKEQESLIKVEESSEKEKATMQEALGAVTNQEQFDLSALELEGAFYEDMKQKLTSSDDGIIAQVMKLMQNYVSYIDNVSNLSVEQRHSALGKFPPQDKAFYGCLGGIEGRLLNTRLGLNLSDTEPLLYKIHNDIAEKYLSKFIKHVATDNEAHTPFALLLILGVEKEIIVEIDEDYEVPISDILITDAIEFLSTYEQRFKEKIDSLVADILSYVEKNQAYELSALLKPYGIDINPLSHEIHPTQLYKFSEQDSTSIEWLQDNIDRFLKGLEDLKTADPALPLITINQSKERAEQLKEIMLQLLDPELPTTLAQDILSDDTRRQTKAINVLYFLGETFVGGSSHQFLEAIKSQDVIEKLTDLKEVTDFDSATHQRLDIVIQKAQYYQSQPSSANSTSFLGLLASNIPLCKLKAKLAEHEVPLTSEDESDIVSVSAALATRPDRHEILELLPSKPFSQDLGDILVGMWRYSAMNRFPDFIKDLCEFSKRNEIDILPFLQSEADRGFSIIAHMIEDYPEGFAQLMPLFQELTDDKKIELVETITSKNDDEKTNSDFGLTLLHVACQNKRAAILKDLLSLNTDSKRKFFDLEKKTDEGYTVLELAVKIGHKEMAEKLLEAGAKFNVKNTQGNSVLHVAAQNGHTEIVKELLRNGAYVNSQGGKRNDTALSAASQKGYVDMATLLLESGAEVDVENELGVTAIYFAVNNGHDEIVKLLLENGADPSKEARNVTGRTYKPISFAIDKPKIKGLLEKYQNARETIFQSSDDEYFNALIAKINSFTESDLFTAKTFNCNGNEIQLNAFGILNLYRDFKDHQRIADQGQSARPSTSMHIDDGEKKSLETAIAGLKEKAGIKEVSYDRKRRRSSESLMERGEATKART